MTRLMESSFLAISRQTWTIRGMTGGDDPVACLGSGDCGVADDARPCDVPQHVHWDDHLRARVSHAVLAEGGPPGIRLPSPLRRDPRRRGWPASSRRADRVPGRARSSSSLGVNHGPLDVGEDIGSEVHPLDEEHPLAGRLEVVGQNCDGEGGDVATVPVDGDEVLEAVFR